MKQSLGCRTTDLTACIFFSLPDCKVPEYWDYTVYSLIPQRAFHNAKVDVWSENYGGFVQQDCFFIADAL